MRAIEKTSDQTDFALIEQVAITELRELVHERAQVNRRISILRKTVRALSANGGTRNPRTYAEIGLTLQEVEGVASACRSLLRQANRPLTMEEITEAVRLSQSPKAKRRRRLLLSISFVLRNLLESGEVNNAFDEDGTRTWFATQNAPQDPT